MGKYLRKCGGIGELAVMEVTQAVGVRTRARTLALAAAAAAAAQGGGVRSTKRRKAAEVVAPVGPAEYQISYLQLRSRSVVLRPQRITRSASSSSLRRRPNPELCRISRCSSNASCEATQQSRPSKPELVEEFDTPTCKDSNGERRETTPLPIANRGDEASDLESTAERESRRRPTAATTTTTPWEAEIEEFLAAAEREERRRFEDKYNYDVVEDVPLGGGRYEWIPLFP